MTLRGLDYIMLSCFDERFTHFCQLTDLAEICSLEKQWRVWDTSNKAVYWDKGYLFMTDRSEVMVHFKHKPVTTPIVIINQSWPITGQYGLTVYQWTSFFLINDIWGFLICYISIGNAILGDHTMSQTERPELCKKTEKEYKAYGSYKDFISSI